MRLSEAIRLGSLAIQEPHPRDIETCAIGMACQAIGEWKGFFSEDRKPGMPFHWNLATVIEQWPWTHLPKYPNTYWSRLIEMFDDDVCSRTMTLEALCDQVRTWEDELAAKGINVEQVTMVATPDATHEPAAEQTETQTRG